MTVPTGSTVTDDLVAFVTAEILTWLGSVNPLTTSASPSLIHRDRAVAAEALSDALIVYHLVQSATRTSSATSDAN